MDVSWARTRLRCRLAQPVSQRYERKMELRPCMSTGGDALRVAKSRSRRLRLGTSIRECHLAMGLIHCLHTGAACGGSLLPTQGPGRSKPPPYAHGVAPYFQLYGTGQFDGQGSGHSFYGTLFLPTTGNRMISRKEHLRLGACSSVIVLKSCKPQKL